MSNSAGTPGAVPGDGVRPLPPRPDLEFERKRAKKLLRELKRGGARPDVRLADAQFAIAREYGFPSWPKLVQYYETWSRHMRSGPRSRHTLELYDSNVRMILGGHRARRAVVGQMIATFVPRFYGKRNGEIFAATITEGEARLVVAREHRCSSWAELRERAVDPAHARAALAKTQFGQALAAIRARDVGRLALLIDAHPELLEPAASPDGNDSLLRNVLLFERRDGWAEARRFADDLVSRGADVTEALGQVLAYEFRARTEDIAYWLDRGADPDWMPPNGISVLEHALLRYWNGAAVDLVAKRVVPPRAFWVAAGLGDVAGVQSYFDRGGKLTPAARKSRPDFTAAGPSALPCSPDAPDDDILWEAFFVAGLNGRTAVLDYLLERGFNINAMPWGSSLLHFAVGNSMVALVEHLVLRGADLEQKGWRPDLSAREIAEERFLQDPDNPAFSRVYRICHREAP